MVIGALEPQRYHVLMTKNTSLKGFSSALAAAALLCAGFCAPCSAQAPAVDWDGASASAGSFAANDSLRADFRALDAQMAAERQDRLADPAQALDVLASLPACAMVDAVYFRALTADEAAASLKPCAQALSQRYGVQVLVERRPVSVDGVGAVPGILLRVRGDGPAAVLALRDLGTSVRDLRRAKLMGAPAGVAGDPAPR